MRSLYETKNSRPFFSLFLSIFTIACGKEPRTLVVSKALPTVRSTTNFTGTWAMKLKGTKDRCGLGLKNKSFPGTILVRRQKRVTLTIQGIAKAFKGTANGSSLLLQMVNMS